MIFVKHVNLLWRVFGVKWNQVVLWSSWRMEHQRGSDSRTISDRIFSRKSKQMNHILLRRVLIKVLVHSQRKQILGVTSISVSRNTRKTCLQNSPRNGNSIQRNSASWWSKRAARTSLLMKISQKHLRRNRSSGIESYSRSCTKRDTSSTIHAREKVISNEESLRSLMERRSINRLRNSNGEISGHSWNESRISLEKKDRRGRDYGDLLQSKNAQSISFHPTFIFIKQQLLHTFSHYATCMRTQEREYISEWLRK